MIYPLGTYRKKQENLLYFDNNIIHTSISLIAQGIPQALDFTAKITPVNFSTGGSLAGQFLLNRATPASQGYEDLNLEMTEP